MNPELMRLYWSRFSWAALVVSFLCILILLSSFFKIGNQQNPDYILKIFLVLQGGVLGLFALGTIGNVLKADATHQIWEQQKMSACSAWSLTLGKLSGITLTLWLLSIAVTLLFTLYFRAYAISIVRAYLLIVLLAVSFQALMIASMIWSRFSNLALAALIVFIFNILFRPADISPLTSAQVISWWGLEIPAYYFYLASSVGAVLLTLIILWRTIRYELLMPSYPWLIPVLIVIYTIFLGGLRLFSEGAAITNMVWLAFYGTVVLFYFVLVGETFHFAHYRRLQSFLLHRNLKMLVCAVPLWLVLYGIIILLFLCLLMLEGYIPVMGIYLACLTRDLLIVLCFQIMLEQKFRSRALVTLFLLYVLHFKFSGQYTSLKMLSINSTAAMTIMLVQIVILLGIAPVLWYKKVKTLGEV